MYICWEYGELRLCVPGQENYLLSYYEVDALARAAEARADAATTARMMVEARAYASASPRSMTKIHADAEVAERRRIEDELRRFRERFGDLDESE